VMFKRVLIFGHAGRGKTTFAAKLAAKLNIPYYSTDDFFYIKKFSVVNTKEQSVIDIKKIYEMDEWIIEGTTSRLIKPGVERAEIIFILKFKNILPQYYYIIKRSFDRKYEEAKGTWDLLKHVTKKRYKKGYGSNLPTIEELKEKGKKVIELNSINAIEKYLASINI
jgi:adenylate kinase family enzyme